MNDREFLQTQYDKLLSTGSKSTDRDMQRFGEIIRCTSPFTCHQVFEDLSDRPLSVHEVPWGKLSDAEMQVCRLMGAGKTSTQISKLYPKRSLKTIETHTQHAKVKLGIDSTNDLRHLCYQRFSQ